MGRGRNGKRGGYKNPNPGGMITHTPKDMAWRFRKLEGERREKDKERKRKLEELRGKGEYSLDDSIDTQIHHTMYGFDTRVDYFEGEVVSDRAVRVACEMDPLEIEFILMRAKRGRVRFELKQFGSVDERGGNRVTVFKFDDFYKIGLIKALGTPARNELAGMKKTVRVLQDVIEEYLGERMDLR